MSTKSGEDYIVNMIKTDSDPDLNNKTLQQMIQRELIIVDSVEGLLTHAGLGQQASIHIEIDEVSEYL